MINESWNGNNHVFRTYAKGDPSGDGKAPAKGQKLKGRETILSFEDASKNPCFGGMLRSGIVDISFDTDDLSGKFWDMADHNKWKCLILENPDNGHIHSYWNVGRRIDGGGYGELLEA